MSANFCVKKIPPASSGIRMIVSGIAADSYIMTTASMSMPIIRNGAETIIRKPYMDMKRVGVTDQTDTFASTNAKTSNTFGSPMLPGINRAGRIV